MSLRSATAMIFGVVAQAAALVAFAGGVTNPTAISGPVGATPVAAIAVAATSSATSLTAANNTATLSAATDASGAPAPSHSSAPAASRPFAAPETVSAPTAPTAGGLAQVTFALLLVLVAIFAVAWVARRMRGFNNRVGGAIDVLADVPLGQKERAVLLKVGSKQILLGVAPGRVNTLHVLEEPLELNKAPSGPNDSRPNFKQLMLRSLGK